MNELLFKCITCNKEFESIDELTAHDKEEHDLGKISEDGDIITTAPAECTEPDKPEPRLKRLTYKPSTSPCHHDDCSNVNTESCLKCLNNIRVISLSTKELDNYYIPFYETVLEATYEKSFDELVKENLDKLKRPIITPNQVDIVNLTCTCNNNMDLNKSMPCLPCRGELEDMRMDLPHFTTCPVHSLPYKVKDLEWQITELHVTNALFIKLILDMQQKIIEKDAVLAEEASKYDQVYSELSEKSREYNDLQVKITKMEMEVTQIKNMANS